ncbi:MAG: oligosaccharide flippase family protein [Acidimicrobiales bacterium]
MVEVTEGDTGNTGDIGRKAAGGFVWALVGFVVMQIGSFATYWFATRILGASDIGVVGTALTLVFWIDVLLGLGMGASLIFEQEQGQSERVAVAFTVNLAVAGVLAVAIFFGAGAIDRFVGAHDPAIFRVVALLVLVKGLGQVPDSILRRDLDFRRRVRADFTRSILRFGVSVALLESGRGPISMVIGVVAAEMCATAVVWVLVRFKPVIHFDRAIAGQMLRFGGAMFGAQLVGMLWLQGDYLVITRHFGGKSRAFGQYYTAFRLPELVLGSVYNIFSNVAFPAYSAARATGDEALRNASLKSLRILCLFGFSAGVGMSLISRDFITVVYPGFEGAIPVMQLLCLAGGFVAVGYASGDLFAAIGKPRLGLYFQLVFVPVLVGGFILFVSHGITAIAMVHLAVIVPYSIFRIEVANRLLGTTWRQSLAALRPATVMVLGIVAFALPVRLLTTAGFASLLAVFVAGALGAVAGLAIGDRVMLAEVGEGIGKVRARIGR